MVERAESGDDARRRWGWQRGRVLAALAVLTAVLLAFPRIVPNAGVRLGSLLESFLPWLGLAVVVLLGLALPCRSATALVALLLPAAVWAYVFGPLFLPAAEPAARDLVVVQHNVSDENTDPQGTARALADAGPDLIALEELVPRALPVYEKTLAREYPYQPRGRMAAYVAHLPPVRVGAGGLGSAWRDESAGLLGRAVAAERVKGVLLLGDLNSTVDDRGLSPLTSRMNVAERGFAFSSPAAFPLARIDQVMARSATVGHIRTLPATGSDHLPVTARITRD